MKLDNVLTLKDLKEQKPSPSPKLKKKGFDFSQPILVPLLLLLVVVGTGFNTVMNLYLAALVAARADDGAKAFVQMDGGQAIPIQKVDRLARTEETLTNYAQSMMTLCLNWTGEIDGKPDEGAKHRNLTVPTPLIACSNAFEPRLKLNYLDAAIPAFQADQFIGKKGKQAILSIEKVFPPVERPDTPGVWDIKLITTRMIYQAGVHTSNDPYNVTMTLAAIDPPQSPLGEDASILEKAVYKARSSGLMIIGLKEEI